MNFLRKNKKGFTLTELIIVIVIIGILAGVLIPSLTGYINKAKVAKGVAEAKSMSVVLSAEAAYQNREYFESYEISRILEEVDYNLTSSMKDYRYWYDASKNEIKFLKISEVFGGSEASGVFTQDCIEALSSVHPEYRYVDNYDDELTNVVKVVRNLPILALTQLSKDGQTLAQSGTPEEKLAVLDKMDELLGEAMSSLNNLKYDGFTFNNKTNIINYVATFDTTESVYIDSNIMYNRAYFTPKSELTSLANSASNVTYTDNIVSLELAHVIFAPETTKVPSSSEVAKDATTTFEVVITTAFEIPDTVTTVVNGAFTNVVLAAGIVAKDTVMIDNDALSASAKAAMAERTSNVSFITLYYGVDFTIAYMGAEAKLDNGSVVAYSTYNEENKTYLTVDLSTLVYDDTKLTTGTTESSHTISKYLIPNIKFIGTKINFNKVAKVIIRRSLLENICTYSAIIVDSDLKCYKVENFGYVSDVDWNIEQNFISKDASGNKVIGADSAIVEVTLPTYVYNYVNFKGACMEVVLLPQAIKEREVVGYEGVMDVFDGIAMTNNPIKIYIEDGVYDAQRDCYVYTKQINDLKNNPMSANGVTYTCNQLSVSQISIYTGDATNNINNIEYLFIRYYK